MTIRIETIADPADLATIASDWQALAAAAPTLSVFQHPAWVLAWCRVFADQGSLCVQVAYRDGRLVGLAPLLVANGAAGGGTARFLGAPLNDFNDFLVDPVDPEPVVVELWRALVDDGSWTTLELMPVRPDAALRVGGRLPSLTGVRGEPLAAQPAPEVWLDDDWEAYRLGLAKRHRHGWERSLARMLAAHVVRVHALEDPEALRSAVKRFACLRLASWAARGRLDELVAAQRDDRFPGFLATAAADLAAVGQCVLIELEIDGAVAAADLYLTQGRTALLYLRMFLPEFASLGPGISLALLGLRLLHARGFRAIWLGRGGEDYKYRLGGRDVLLERAILQRGSRVPRL